MEITAQTFLSLGEHLDFRQQLALRAALGNNRMGLLPDSEFTNTGSFVKNRFEMDRFRCMAVLPSGRLIDADESVSIAIPMLYGSEYYLAVGFGSSQIEFEKDGVPFVRPQYIYSICSLEDIAQDDLLPVVRFQAENGVFSIDSDFIPPCLLLAEDSRFQKWLNRYIEIMQLLVAHDHMEDGEGKQVLLRYLFRLKSLGKNNSVHDAQLLLEELVQAVNFFVLKEKEWKVENEEWLKLCDIQRWMKHAEDYLTGALSYLDTIIPEDNTIDYAALLEEAKRELYERLNPELYEKLLLQIKDDLRTELENNITHTITSYVDTALKPEIERVLNEKLHDVLYDRLYTELYDRLFNALYVPEPEEAEFVPMI